MQKLNLISTKTNEEKLIDLNKKSDMFYRNSGFATKTFIITPASRIKRARLSRYG